MSQSGPTGDELVAISRSHKLICQPMFIMTTTADAAAMGAVLENLATHLEYWAEMERQHVLFVAAQPSRHRRALGVASAAG